MSHWLGRAGARIRVELRHSALFRVFRTPSPGSVEQIPAFDKKLPTGTATYTPAKRFRTRRRDRGPQPPRAPG